MKLNISEFFDAISFVRREEARKADARVSQEADKLVRFEQSLIQALGQAKAVLNAGKAYTGLDVQEILNSLDPSVKDPRRLR